MRASGARIIVECILEQGVQTVFGYPGGTVLNIYDELYKNADRLRHVLCSHEQHAAHAADGYARASGRVGVVIATSGPGATNLVTGLATAFLDSSPVVAITGSVARALKGRDSFQEIDIASITMPVTKHNFVVREAAELASTLRRAFDIARSGRPGPVLVDVPKDLTAAEADWEPEAPRPRSALAKGAVPAGDDEIAAAAELLRVARRPLVVAGGGVIAAGASAALAELCDRLDAPVALTLMGLGALPSDHPRLTGLIGMHGSPASNRAAMETDLLVAVGMRFSDRVIGDPSRFPSGSQVLHLDADPSEIGKNIRCYRSLVGDAGDILGRLLPLLERRARPEWAARAEALRSEDRAAALRDTEIRASEPDSSSGTSPEADARGGVRPRELMAAVAEAFGDSAVLTTEVGQHQLWTAQYYPFTEPRTFISSCGLGTMGFGTGAAIGAQVARPGARVVHIAGDGSFRMNCAELSTMARYRLPVVVVIANNGVLGMVRQWQTMFYGRRYAETDLDCAPDFVRLAEAFGVRARRATDPGSLRAALAEAASLGEPYLVDCAVDRDECVLPIVPPGRAIGEQVLSVAD